MFYICAPRESFGKLFFTMPWKIQWPAQLMRHTRDARREGWVKYRRIYNGFPLFRLAVFSMAWYKSLYLRLSQ